MDIKKIDWWRTSFGQEEISMLTKSMSEEHISQGPVTAEFEAQFAKAMNVPYAVATTSGSVALLMSLMAMGVKRGDEVIVSNRTFIATAHAPLMLGAKVVLVDVHRDVPVMDVSLIKKKITARTKAIMPVHLCGRAVDLAGIHRLAKAYGLCVIEDACQAMFSKNERGYLGTQSDVGCFSLGVTKLISSGQGGVVVTSNRRTYEELKLIRNHGVPGTFEATYPRLGFNFKFTDIQAAIGLAQLRRVKDRLLKLHSLYRKYEGNLKELDFPFLRLIPVNVNAGEVPLYIEALCQNRDSVRNYLNSRGIEVRPFLPNLNQSPHIKNGGSFPHSTEFSKHGFFLPSGPDQSDSNVDRVLNAMQSYVRRKKIGLF
ncbi:MAG: DegT/DnrJ/EryC1/StrS family aminotransferase [Elusimicrobia bacterium]|nr:DegT/DnrJ/EryC1/StrS family aminotransferase [Elusimicrobiota bacterium]